jgi:hypothetical protein
LPEAVCPSVVAGDFDVPANVVIDANGIRTNGTPISIFITKQNAVLLAKFNPGDLGGDGRDPNGSIQLKNGVRIDGYGAPGSSAIRINSNDFVDSDADSPKKGCIGTTTPTALKITKEESTTLITPDYWHSFLLIMYD